MTSTENLENNRIFIVESYKDGKSTCELGREFGCSNALIYLFLRDKCGVKMRQKPKLEELKDEIIQMYADKLTIYKMSKRLGVPQPTLNRWMKSLGLDVSRNSTHRAVPLIDVKEEIVQKYKDGKGCTVLSKEYDCGESSITNLLKKEEVEIRGPERIRFFNEDFFEKIDSEESAYFLGMMYGDGNNSDRSASLALTDLDVIQKFATALDYENPHIEERGRSVNGHKTMYRLRLNSVKTCNDLTKVGCHPNKTHILDFPSEEILPKYLYSHFLRGLLDADGTISIANSPYAGYIGNDKLMLGIKQFFKQELNVDMNVYHHKNSKRNIITIRTGKAYNLNVILNFLYKDATIYMDRKYSKYLEFKEWHSNQLKEGKKKRRGALRTANNKLKTIDKGFQLI